MSIHVYAYGTNANKTQARMLHAYIRGMLQTLMDGLDSVETDFRDDNYTAIPPKFNEFISLVDNCDIARKATELAETVAKCNPEEEPLTETKEVDNGTSN